MGDKRKVSTDALETLGTIIGPEEKRDAIHLAVEPIEAGEKLNPGQRIGIMDGKAYDADIRSAVVYLGIVDPFLPGPVYAGQRFWLILLPRTIESLRHVWTHPAFPDEGNRLTDAVRKSSAWLQRFFDKYEIDEDDEVSPKSQRSPSYDRVLAGIKATLEGKPVNVDPSYGFNWDDGLYFYGSTQNGEIPREFWDHIEIVLGIPVPEEMRQHGDYFACSC